MAEHPIVPIDQDQIPVPKKRQNRRQNNNLVLNVRTSSIEFNFYKGVNRELMTDIVEKLLNEND